MPATADPVPAPDEHPRGIFANAPDQAEQREETSQEMEHRPELSLSGQESPNQNDPGEERKEEAEETFYAQ